jgi:hypothetical protein
VRLEGLGKLKKSPHRDAIPRPSGLQHSASINYAIACPQYMSERTSKQNDHNYQLLDSGCVMNIHNFTLLPTKKKKKHSTKYVADSKDIKMSGTTENSTTTDKTTSSKYSLSSKCKRIFI